MSEIEHDNAAKLARMARQIAQGFGAYPQAQAAEEVATHINKFWSPRMREDFLAAFPEDDTRLDPVIRAARSRIRRATSPGG